MADDKLILKDAIDVLYDELKNKSPHWLSLPERDPKRAEEIRAKHRARYLAEKAKLSSPND